MHAILNILLIELDFLLDDKVSAELQNENPKEQLLIKLNVLRKVLAIKDESEMTRLLMDIYQNARKAPSNRGAEDSGFTETGRREIDDRNEEEDRNQQGDARVNYDVDQYEARESDDNYGRGDPEADRVGRVSYRIITRMKKTSTSTQSSSGTTPTV